MSFLLSVRRISTIAVVLLTLSAASRDCSAQNLLINENNFWEYWMHFQDFPCDFNRDHTFTLLDIDILSRGVNANIGANANSYSLWLYDRNGDEVITYDDIAACIRPGDTNWDGAVDSEDFNMIGVHYNQFVPNPGGLWLRATWADGDFNGDGVVDIEDLTIYAINAD